MPTLRLKRLTGPPLRAGHAVPGVKPSFHAPSVGRLDLFSLNGVHTPFPLRY